MDFSTVNGLGYTNAQASASSAAASSLQNAARGLSAKSSEEELKGVLKDFESYFLEQVFKEMKDSLTWSDKDDEDHAMAQYKDMFMDQAIEMLADDLVDDLGESLTQQLYEQMRRNYNIPEAE